MTDYKTDVHGDLPFAVLPETFEDRAEVCKVAFERTRMPMVVTDARRPDNPIILANKAFLHLTGYEAEEVLGRNCRFLQGPSTSPEAIATVHGGLDEGKDIDVELLNYRKDGTTFWNQLHISPIRDDNGAVAYHFASQVDVTAYRKVQHLEASEHRLLKEVDHRAKNALAIVSSLVRMSRSDDPAHFAAAVQRRVQALAQAHALLSDRGWKEVGLREVVEGEVQDYLPDRIELTGPEVSVSPNAVQPLVLVIHELMANATTHGALSSEDGRLDLNWKKIDDFGGFRMTWIESGAPARNSSPEKAGFGTVMVKALIETQLSGYLHRVWQARGLTLTLEIPGNR